MSNPNNSLEQKPLSFLQKIKNFLENTKNWFKEWGVLFKEVFYEFMNNIEWTPIWELLSYIKQFTIVAIFSIIFLFIIDNIIIYLLKLIF